jgi:hypothetical protein
MDTDRLLTELEIVGDFDEKQDRHPPVIRLMQDVLEHGEVHAEFGDDSDRYVELRQGTTTFDFDGEIFVIDDGITGHYFTMNQLVNWERPRNVFEPTK